MYYCGEIEPRIVRDLLEGNTRELVICSPGGCVYSAFGAVDIIRHNALLHITAVGFAMSAAVLIVAAGSRRLAYPSTRFMVHAVSGGLSVDGAEQAQAESDEFAEVQRVYFNGLEKFTKKRASWWRKKCASAPYYFDAIEALKLGVIDEIIPEVATVQK